MREHPSMHILSLERTPIADPWRARACIESCTELPQERFYGKRAYHDIGASG